MDGLQTERQFLLDVTSNMPTLRAVVERARPHAEIKGLLVVHATVRELDEMYSLVEALMSGARGQRKRDLLEELLAGLCTSMDGF